MPLTKHDLGSLVCIVINLRGWTTEERGVKLHCAEMEKIFTVYNSFGASYPVDGY